VLAHSTHRELVIKIIEKPFDIQIQDPAVAPTPLARYTDCLDR
jgi:hypothetical protein